MPITPGEVLSLTIALGKRIEEEEEEQNGWL
jgi:hypothetical protein